MSPTSSYFIMTHLHQLVTTISAETNMATSFLLSWILLHWGCCYVVQCQQPNAMFPIRLPHNDSEGPGSQSLACPTTNFSSVRQNVIYPPCFCGGAGGWTRVAYLNMSDPNQQCPSNWKLITTPFKGCGRLSTNGGSCDSVVYPVNGRTYSSVCGRLNP